MIMVVRYRIPSPEVLDEIKRRMCISEDRIENLRDVPNSINSRNKKIHRGNISGLSGVTWEKTKECWRVRINKNIDIKRTPDFFEACCARKSAENSLAYHENHGRSK